jgi:glycosyltransferase involved in cell wall biosynthesis
VHAQLLARAARVICESSQVQADIIGTFGIAEQRTVVITAPPLQPLPADASDDRLHSVRIRLLLPEKFLFYPAQFWVHKNHLRLIEAFAEAVTEVPDLKLVLTGKKRDEYDVVMRAIGKFGLGDKVCHLGYVEQDDLAPIYRLATALIMPSLFESVSIPIYEAFQVGTPVMASNILAIPEQVGDAGLLFDPSSVASIKQAILKMTADPEAARRLAKRGQDRMSAMTPERYGAQLKDLLSEILRTRT